MPKEIQNTGATIIEYDAEMRRGFVLNEGKSGECGDTLAKRLIDEGRAEVVGSKKAKGKKSGKKAAAKKADSAPTELGEARKRYRDAFGKNPGPKWSIEEIDAKIAEKAADEGGNDGPPTE